MCADPIEDAGVSAAENAAGRWVAESGAIIGRGTLLQRERYRFPVTVLGAIAVLLLLANCGSGAGQAPDSSQPPTTEDSGLSAAAQLGQKIFADKSLSASGQMSCATCHDPKANYAAPNALVVQLGGPDTNVPGFRTVPSLEYNERTGSFVTDNGSDSPSGGFTWDGRASTLQAQPQIPLLASNEMANASAADVVAKLQKATYAQQFAQLFGAGIFQDPDTALVNIGFALARYQIEDPSFHPYNSKYDYYLAGKVALTDQEMRGLQDFDDPKVGCSGCHLDTIGADGFPGSSPVFTDHQFEAVGVPRNASIPANADPTYFDMGLCGPLRTDLSTQTQYCGMFKTPTLRNVANRHVFFHNGYFTNLNDTLHFYVERDTNAAQWYPMNADGSVDKFNDLPAQYRTNVDFIDPPFNLKPGDPPALDETQIQDVLAFLQTLTDGYTPPTPPATQ